MINNYKRIKQFTKQFTKMNNIYFNLEEKRFKNLRKKKNN